jgi:hypothetical protein
MNADASPVFLCALCVPCGSNGFLQWGHQRDDEKAIFTLILIVTFFRRKDYLQQLELTAIIKTHPYT